MMINVFDVYNERGEKKKEKQKCHCVTKTITLILTNDKLRDVKMRFQPVIFDVFSVLLLLPFCCGSRRTILPRPGLSGAINPISDVVV